MSGRNRAERRRSRVPDVGARGWGAGEDFPIPVAGAEDPRRFSTPLRQKPEVADRQSGVRKGR
jgi:hypothetical protein